MTPFERFTADGIEAIRHELEDVSEFAIRHKEDHELISIIDNLARIAAMFADVKAQELKGKVNIVDPEGYIHTKLASIQDIMNNYAK